VSQRVVLGRGGVRLQPARKRPGGGATMTTGHVDIHRTAGGASLVLFAMCLGLGLNYLFGVFIARWLGADAFGLYAVGVAVCGAVSVLAVLALDNAVLRYLPQLKAREPEQRGAFIKASLVAVAVAGSL